MEWWQRFGVAATALGDAASSAWDIVQHVTGNSPDAQRDMLGALVTLPVSIGNAAFQSAAAPIQGLYQGYSAVTEPIDNAIHRVGATPFLVDDLTQSNAFRAEQARQGNTGWLAASVLDPETWNRAWKEAEHISIGQALLFNNMKTPIIEKNRVDEMKDSILFNVATGLTDAAVAWYADPVGGALTAVGKVKKVNNVFGAGHSYNDPWLEQLLAGNSRLSKPLGRKPTNADPDALADSEPVDEFLAWAANRPAHEIIKHPVIARMPTKDDAAGILATLIGREGAGDVETAKQVIALGYGSQAARDALLAKGNDLSTQLKAMENLDNPQLRKAIAEKNPKEHYTDRYLELYAKYEEDVANGIDRNPPSPRYKFGTLDELKQDIKQKTALEKAITAAIGERDEAAGIMGHMINQVPKLGQTKTADRLLAYDHGSFSQWNEALFSKPFAPALKVVNYANWKVMHAFTDKRPPSWIDPNRKDASAALWAYMKTSKAFDETEMQTHLNDYINALDITARKNVINRIEGDAIVGMAKKYGIDTKLAGHIAKESMGKKNRIVEKIRMAQHRDMIFGTKGPLTDDEGNVIRLPRFETQQLNSIPLLDLQAHDRIFKKHTGMIKALGWSNHYSGSLTQFADDSFELFRSVWSATNLLRAGYTIRNVTDDTLRTLASLGTMDFMGRASAGVKYGLGNSLLRVSNAGRRSKVLGAVVGEKRKGGTRYEIAQRVAGRIDQMGRDLHSLRGQTADGFVLDGHKYNGPYAGRAAAFMKVVGANYDSLAGTTRTLQAEFRNDYSHWDVIKPDAPNHLQSWAHAIQNQIGNSEIGKRFLEGMSAAEVKHWLENTTYGRATRRKLGAAGKDTDRVVGEAQAIIDYMVPLMRNMDDPWILRTMAAKGEVNEEALAKLFSDPDLRPEVHGPTIDLNLSEGISGKISSIVDTGFKWLGTMPTDKLVRHPVFRSMYIGNIRRLHDNLRRQVSLEKITDKDFARIEHAARELSLQQLNRLLFDGSTKSNMAHYLRFVTGFFSAWEDSVTKWARIAYDKPETLVQGMKIWNAPNQVNLGSTEDPMTGKRVPRWQVLRKDPETGEYHEAGKEWDPWNVNDPNVVIQARLPSWLEKFVPFMREDDGSVTIAKSSLNLSLQGDAWWLPGAGPIVNMAVGKYALDHPTSLPEVFKWAIPYGGEDNMLYSLLPAWSRRLWDSGESITDGTRAQAFINIAQTQIMKAKLGKRDMPATQAEFYKEIEGRVDSFFKLRAFTSFFSPVAVQYDSPFKFYIDSYRQLKAQEASMLEAIQKEKALRKSDPGHWVPVTADELFLENYGEDFYGFTTSVSKNNLGFMASAEAWEKSKRPDVQKYIEAGQYDLAALAAGKIEDTAFNQYVYDAQMKQQLKPGSDMTARQRQSPDEAIKENQVHLGWSRFTRTMDLIDGMQFNQGMDPDEVDRLRSTYAKTLASIFPDWGREYLATDPEKVPARIKDFQRFIVENQKLVRYRPDLQKLSLYLTERDRMLAQLKARDQAGGAKTLNGKENADLAQQWKNVQVGLAESDTDFGRLFWRYLSNDRLQVSVTDGT